MTVLDSEGLRAELHAIDRDVLLAIAGFLKFDVPADVDKPELIERLLKNYPTELARYLRTVRHVELLKAQQSMPDEVRKGFLRLVGSLEFLKTAAGVVLGVASAVAGLAAYTGFKNYWDLQQAIATQQKVNTTQKRLAIEQAWESTETILRRMTLAQPLEPRMADVLNRQVMLLKDAEQWSGAPTGLDDVSGLLLKTIDATLSMKGLEISKATTLDDLSAADEKWKAVLDLVGTPAPQSAFVGVAKRIKGYALNSAGILALLRFDRNRSDRQLIQTAARDFGQAEEALPGFARIVSNRGVVLAKTCDGEPSAVDTCLERASREYARAFSYTDTPAELVTLYNNIAMIGLRRARLKLADRAYGDAEKLLALAEKSVIQAESQPSNTSVAFGTHSQIAALGLAIEILRKGEINPGGRETLRTYLVKATGFVRASGSEDDSCGQYLSTDLFTEADFLELRKATTATTPAAPDFLTALAAEVCRS